MPTHQIQRTSPHPCTGHCERTMGDGCGRHIEVPPPSQRNEYILVAQDYSSKWPFARTLPDQTSAQGWCLPFVWSYRPRLVLPESHSGWPVCSFQGEEISYNTISPHGGWISLTNKQEQYWLSCTLMWWTQRETGKRPFSWSYFTTGQPSTSQLNSHQTLNPPSLHFPNLPCTSVLEPAEYSLSIRNKRLEPR